MSTVMNRVLRCPRCGRRIRGIAFYRHVKACGRGRARTTTATKSGSLASLLRARVREEVRRALRAAGLPINF